VKTLSFEQMEQVNGEGLWGALGCMALFAVWGAVLGTGLAVSGGLLAPAAIVATETAWVLIGGTACAMTFA